jgi:hypothetical protein
MIFTPQGIIFGTVIYNPTFFPDIKVPYICTDCHNEFDEPEELKPTTATAATSEGEEDE